MALMNLTVLTSIQKVPTSLIKNVPFFQQHLIVSKLISQCMCDPGHFETHCLFSLEIC